MESRGENINAKELNAGTMAIKAFAKQMTNLHVILFMDNATAISQVNKKSSTSSKVENNDRVMGVLCEQKYLGIRDLYPGKNEQSSRYLVQGMEGIEQLDDKQVCVQSVRTKFRDDGSRFIRRPSKLTKENVCEMETRSLCNEHRRVSDQLVGNGRVCVPSLLPDRQGSKENKNRKGIYLIDHTYMANTNLVPYDIRSKIRTSNTTSAHERPSQRPKRPRSPANDTERINLSGLESVRDCAKDKGVSEDAA